jgi:hypothetical protein
VLGPIDRAHAAAPENSQNFVRTQAVKIHW